VKAVNDCPQNEGPGCQGTEVTTSNDIQRPTVGVAQIGRGAETEDKAGDTGHCTGPDEQYEKFHKRMVIAYLLPDYPNAVMTGPPSAVCARRRVLQPPCASAPCGA